MRFQPRAVVFLLAAIFLAGLHGRAGAQAKPKTVNIHVDSVLAADTNEGMDARLAPMGHRLQALFNYSTYRLVSHQDGGTTCGKMIAFTLPGGRILHVQPRLIDRNMISMELVLFQGSRPMITTDLKLRNNGVLIIGGPRYEQGMLIISIAASTADAPPADRAPTTPAEAHQP